METKSKKDFYKNALIVFLIIMLILTFFSNTITNITLPTVTTQSVYGGTISSGLRASGNAEIGESYVMKADATRKVESVAVEKGAHVNKGDVIYYLAEEESEELAKAEEELNKAELDYYKSLLASDMSAEVAAKVNANGLSSFDSYIAQLDALEKEIDATKQAVVDSQTMVDNAKAATKAAAVNQAGNTDDAELEKLTADLCKSKDEAEFNNNKNETIAALTREINDLTNSLTDNTKSASDTVQALVDGLKKSIKGGKYANLCNGIDDTTISEQTIVVLKGYVSSIKKAADGNMELQEDTKNKELIYNLIREANSAVEDYTDAIDKESTLKQIEELNAAKDELTALTFTDTDKYTEAVNRVNAATDKETRIKSAATKENALLALQEETAMAYNQTATKRLEELEKEKKALNTDIEKSLEADSYSKTIERKKAEIEKLKEKYVEGVIKAEVSGKISAINVVAGERMEKEKEICTIIPDGKSFQVRLSANNNDIKNLKVGSAANFEDSWNYQDATAIVTSIKDDPNDPGKKSEVTFDVEGSNIKEGSSISLTAGLVEKKYDIVVPKSAVKKDSQGDFVWLLHSKESAIGNKYTVERVEVKVTAEDDRNAAISGNIMQGDSIVVTTSKEIENGKRVRLSDTNNE